MGYLVCAVNGYHLILVLVLHQELRYIYFYYQYAQMSSYQLQNSNIFPMFASVNKNTERESNPMPQ